MIVYVSIGIIYAITGIVASCSYYVNDYNINCGKYHDISDYLDHNYSFFDMFLISLFWPVAVIVTVACSFRFIVLFYIKIFGGKK